MPHGEVTIRIKYPLGNDKRIVTLHEYERPTHDDEGYEIP